MNKKFWNGVFALSVTLHFLLPAKISASDDDRQKKCYFLSEEKNMSTENFSHYFCIYSSDLKKYPSSVVSFEIFKFEKPEPAKDGEVINRALASEGLSTKPSSLKKRIAKRHYNQLSPNVFGSKCRGGKKWIELNEDEKSVKFIFLDPSKTYYFSEEK